MQSAIAKAIGLEVSQPFDAAKPWLSAGDGQFHKKVLWTQARFSACSDSSRVPATRRRSNVHEVHNPVE
jgi:hypothetical protein